MEECAIKEGRNKSYSVLALYHHRLGWQEEGSYRDVCPLMRTIGGYHLLSQFIDISLKYNVTYN